MNGNEDGPLEMDTYSKQHWY